MKIQLINNKINGYLIFKFNILQDRPVIKTSLPHGYYTSKFCDPILPSFEGLHKFWDSPKNFLKYENIHLCGVAYSEKLENGLLNFYDEIYYYLFLREKVHQKILRSEFIFFQFKRLGSALLQ